jgi:hypothetical protein
MFRAFFPRIYIDQETVWASESRLYMVTGNKIGNRTPVTQPVASYYIVSAMTACVCVKTTYMKFEVFTAVTMKNAVFWDVAPCRYCIN